MGYSFEQMMQGYVDDRGKNTLNTNQQKPINPIEGGQAFLDRQNKLAQQQALMQAVAKTTTYSGLTDKVFGKSQQGAGLDPQRVRIGAYVILGAVVGRYVAKNMGKSTTLGIVVGGLAPLLAYQLTLEYDKKKALKQAPESKGAIEPTPMPNKPKPFGNKMQLDLKSEELSKTPSEFTIKSNGFNTRYYKGGNVGIFSFIAPDLYKQSFSTNGIGGVQPERITTAEFLNAYNEFLKQPK